MSGWDAYCERIKEYGGSAYLDSTIFNGEGVVYSSPHKCYFAALTAANMKQLIATHDKQDNKSFTLSHQGADYKFICLRHNEGFTVWKHKGKVGDVENPTMVLCRTNTAAVVGMFKDNVGAMVDKTCSLAEALKAANI